MIDAASQTLYAADASAACTRSPLATGLSGRGGRFPLYDDPADELVWGALTLARGHVTRTGSYCDGGPFEGKVISVDVRSKEVATGSPSRRAGRRRRDLGLGRKRVEHEARAPLRRHGTPSREAATRATISPRRPATAENVVSLTPDLKVVAASTPLRSTAARPGLRGLARRLRPARLRRARRRARQ